MQDLNLVWPVHFLWQVMSYTLANVKLLIKNNRFYECGNFELKQKHFKLSLCVDDMITSLTYFYFIVIF